MTSTFKVQIHDPNIFDILTEGKYPVGGYDILDPYKKEDVQHASKEQYLSCDFIFQSDIKNYGRIIEELNNNYTKGNNNYPDYMFKL